MAIVDDEVAAVDMLKEYLECDPRFQVVGMGHNGREALRLANACRPDVMLIDIHMPQLNGLEAAARITSAFPSIAVVIMTANPDPEYIREALSAGARDFLDKPIVVDLLFERIAKAAAKRDPHARSRGFAAVWAFYGSKATSGCTTLAVNVALDLASLQYRVLFMDLDFAAADGLRYLGRTPGVPDEKPRVNLEQVESLTADDVMRLIQRVELPVVPRLELAFLRDIGVSPASPDVPERLTALLELLVTMYDYIVVDLPPARIFESGLAPILDFAERVFMMANQDLSSLAAVETFTKAVSKTHWSFDRLSLLVSELVVQAQLDPRAWLVEHQVPLRELLGVPLDVKSCSRALHQGVPALLLEPDSRYSLFVKALVDRALNRPPARGVRTSLWQKLARLVRHA